MSLESTPQFPQLFEPFLRAMSDIGVLAITQHGHRQNYIGAPWPENRPARWERIRAIALAAHAREHFRLYLLSVPHEELRTRKHQLAAVAFNAMLEFYLDGE